MSSQCVLGVESGSAAPMAAPPAASVAKKQVDAVAPFGLGRREYVSVNRRTAPLQVIGQVLFNIPRPAWIVIDIAIVWLALIQGYHWFDANVIPKHVLAWQAYGVFSFCLIISSLVFGLNEKRTLLNKWYVLTRMSLTTAVSTVVMYAVIYGALYMSFSRRVAALTVITYFVAGISIRLFACYSIHRIKRQLLFVGTRQGCESFVDRMKDGFLNAHSVIGFIDAAEDPALQEDGKLQNLGTTEDIVRVCRQQNVHDIVVCNGSAANSEVISWMLPCLRLGCRVTNEATFYESAAGQILVDEITPDWFLFSDLQAHCEEYSTMKRLFDIVVSIIGLCVSLPFYPLLALAIKLEDGGPVFYSQDRVGKNGAVFKLYKFRTMRVSDASDDISWTARNDPRVTRVGRILRLARLDEFPQFYNILIGHMSVVGPRPERPAIVMELCKYVPYWSERELVKPGLTGWAQISYHYGNTLEDAKRKLQFDFYYLKHMNLELDLTILFRTVGTFLRGAC